MDISVVFLELSAFKADYERSWVNVPVADGIGKRSVSGLKGWKVRPGGWPENRQIAVMLRELPGFAGRGGAWRGMRCLLGAALRLAPLPSLTGSPWVPPERLALASKPKPLTEERSPLAGRWLAPSVVRDPSER